MSERPLKQMAVEKLAPDAERLVEEMRRNRVLLTREGKPFALVVTVEHFGDNYDAEDFDYMTDPEFWKMIQERRKETRYVTLDEVKAELAADEAPELNARGAKRRRRGIPLEEAMARADERVKQEEARLRSESNTARQKEQ